jgi:hypothetical protein
VPPDDLEDAVRVLEGRVGPRLLGPASGRAPLARLRVLSRLLGGAGVGPGAGVLPGLRAVFALLAVEAGEEARQILGVAERGIDDRRGVGVVDGVLLEEGVRVPAPRCA